MSQLHPPMPANARLQILGVEQEYPPSYKLGPVDLTLEPGETVAVLGGNGAGKTTLFQIMTGNADPSAGRVELDGKRLTPDRPDVKRMIGYLPQHLGLPRWVTGHEILDYAACLYNINARDKAVANALEYWDCASYGRKPLGALSHGMKKRVALALATLHNPPCVILDEPFSGLDLFHTRALENEIKRRSANQQITMISTHIAPYVSRLASRVLLVKDGSVSPLEPWTTLDESARTEAIEAHFFGSESPSLSSDEHRGANRHGDRP